MNSVDSFAPLSRTLSNAADILEIGHSVSRAVNENS